MKSGSANFQPIGSKALREGWYERQFVYGHHKDEASWQASKDDGCVICCDFTHWLGDINEHIARLGYYSIFYLSHKRSFYRGIKPQVTMSLEGVKLTDTLRQSLRVGKAVHYAPARFPLLTHTYLIRGQQSRLLR